MDLSDHHDGSNHDESGVAEVWHFDLSPREVVPTAVGRKRKRPVFAIVTLVVVLAAGGVFVAKFLSSAIDYYCNVDEIGHKSGCDVGRTLRIQASPSATRHRARLIAGLTKMRCTFGSMAAARITAMWPSLQTSGRMSRRSSRTTSVADISSRS